MGACHCNDLDGLENRNQLMTDKTREKNFLGLDDDLADTKENLVLVRGGKGLRERQLEDDYQKETPNPDDEENDSVNNTDSNEKVHSHLEEVINEQAKLNYLSSFVANTFEENFELEYFDKSTAMFKLFNDLRGNPTDFQTKVASCLTRSLHHIADEPVDTVLWSKKFYDFAFDYLNSQKNKKVTTKEFNHHINSKINEETGEKFSMLTLSLSRKPDDADINLLSDLLSANLKDGEIVLTSSYSVGFVIIIPSGHRNERVLLCLAKLVD